MCYKILSRNGVISIRNNVISLLFVVLFVNLGIAVGGYHWRFVHPRPYRNYSTQAASSSPTRACFPLACPSCSLQKFYSKVFAGVATLLLSQA